MSPLPEIAPQDLVLGLASAALLLWTLLVVVRSRVFGDILSPLSLDDREEGLFQGITPKRPNRQLAFVGSIFLHLACMSLLPWVEEFAPGKLPFRLRPYDFVVVQFKTVDASLRIPSDLTSVLPEHELPPPPEAELSDTADPGIGNRLTAPSLPGPAGGAEKTPEPTFIERVQIDFPERVAPQREAVAAAQPAAEIPARTNRNLSRRLAAITAPLDVELGLIPPMESANPSPALTASVGGLPEVISGSEQGLQPPAPSALADVPGAVGVTLSAAENNAIRSLLAESYGSGTLLDLLSSANSSGITEGPGIGSEIGPGMIGDFGEGFGEGWRGRGPVPRKLHGIIVISDEPAMPEAAGVLTGNPVYTVYLEVPGFDRKWILQVCEASDESGGLRVQDGVIRIVTRKKMDPPFAFRRVGPRIKMEELDPYSTPPRVVVYAKVDVAGAISSLRIVSGLDPETDDRILASMRDWDFHPAYRDGEAVEVEALFGIPLR